MKRTIHLLVALLLCGQCLLAQEYTSRTLSLMPWPQEVHKAPGKLVIDSSFSVSVSSKKGRVYQKAVNLIRSITDRTGVFVNRGFPRIQQSSTVTIQFDEVAVLGEKIDESYELSVSTAGAIIKAKTDVGALHGMETLLQLLQFDEHSFYIPGIRIKDAPRFAWRGLMIDVARHFQPMAVLKRNLRAMAALKMNVFHWHLSDDQGFRVASKVFPKLQELASDGQYYTQREVKELVAYAGSLGIRVVPEIDVPGHATAILTAYPEYGSKKGESYTIERYAGVFDPTLNPANPEVYSFLATLFKEVSSLFPDPYFHIGGDENEGKHWDQNVEIQQLKKKHGWTTNHEVQTYFNIQLEAILKSYGKKLMGWDEIMTKDMPTSAIIHSWRGRNEGFPNGTLIEAVKKGYQVVLSNDYYIDRMQSVLHHRKFDPLKNGALTAAQEALVLGGEVTMWSELVTPLTIDSRIWPRTAGIAELFWSKAEVVDDPNFISRLKTMDLYLDQMGITHRKNKDQILRNITKSSTVASVQLLTEYFEPLKIYERNKDGVEYKSFSPFTLFADACTADAYGALELNTLIDEYLKFGKERTKKEIIAILKRWQRGYQAFKSLAPNPNLVCLTEHYKAMALIGERLEKALSNTVALRDDVALRTAIKKLETPLVDTEFMVLPSLKQLFGHLGVALAEGGKKS